MKAKKYSLCLITMIIVVGLSLDSWAEDPVKGWYDTQNDWFYFEWEQPSGKKSTIYDPPNKIEPVINAEIIYDKGKGDYAYGYKVANLGGKQLLSDIVVKCFSPVYAATAPSGEWYMDWYRDKTKDAWHWAKTRGELLGIPAGETVSGFSFKSAGLPVIVNSAFFGYQRAEFSPPEYTTEVENAFSAIYQGFKSQYPEKFKTKILKTLGPTAPPKELNPVAFINGIISMKKEAYTLGWITNKGIEMSLDQKLDNAKKKLEQGNITAAKNILNALINEVEAQGCESYETKCPEGRHLKPEAYALLKYNAQYLVDALR